jgi:peptide deformylase
MLEIVTLGEAVLERKAEPVAVFDAALVEFIEEMYEAMSRGKGIGLAAPQVSRSIRLFVTGLDDDKLRVFVNPEILLTSQEECDIEEGCLSIPGLYTKVRRPSMIKMQAFNEKGRPFSLEAEGMLARVLQHEYDHLEGRLFVDRLPPGRKQRALIQYNRIVKM